MKGKKISIESIELSIRKSKMRENAGGNQNGGKNQGHEFVAEVPTLIPVPESSTKEKKKKDSIVEEIMINNT